MRRQQRRKYPETLSEIAAEVAKIMMDRGEEEQKAMATGFEVVEAIRRRWGGVQLYIPRGDAFFISKRDEKILEEFDGKNHRELCHKYGVSLRRIYQIQTAIRAQKRPLNAKLEEE